jgi:hypothetical protein
LRRKEFQEQPKCPNCGGTHYASRAGYCPYTSAPCAVCGDKTIYACSDCQIDLRISVHVCSKNACQKKHEELHEKKGVTSRGKDLFPEKKGISKEEVV